MNANDTYSDGCSYAPGSEEKIEILTARAAERMVLFLAGDAVDCRCARLITDGAAMRRSRRINLVRVLEGMRAGLTQRAIARQLGLSLSSVLGLVKFLRKQGLL